MSWSWFHSWWIQNLYTASKLEIKRNIKIFCFLLNQTVLPLILTSYFYIGSPNIIYPSKRIARFIYFYETMMVFYIQRLCFTAAQIIFKISYNTYLNCLNTIYQIFWSSMRTKCCVNLPSDSKHKNPIFRFRLFA